MNEAAVDNVPDNVAFRHLGIVILTLCGITAGLILAATLVSRFV
jgi:hypothetical protein